MTPLPQELALGGAIGTMALGAMLVSGVRQRDLVALWLALFLACLSAGLLLGRTSTSGQMSLHFALPWLGFFLAALGGDRWHQRAAYVLAAIGAASALTGVVVLVKGLALGTSVWAAGAAVALVVRRRSPWPIMSAAMAGGYVALLFDQLGVDELAPLGVVFFILAPGMVLTRRAIRAFNVDAQRAIDQAKFTSDVFDSVPVALSMRDLEGRYIFVNRTWETYFGHRRESVLGTTPRERASGEDAEALLAFDREALRAGPGVSLPPTDFQLGERRFLQTRTAMADSRGNLLGVLVASIDTTERSLMEQALATEQRRFELVVRAGNAGILDWDGITRTVYYSPRFKEILGYPPDADTAGWPDYFEFVHPEDRERVRGQFRDHILAGKQVAGELDVHDAVQFRLRRRDGTDVWVEGYGTSVRDARGYATRFIAAMTDISERRAQEEALRAAVRLREEVDRMSRHDLKTPLNSVVAMVRLLCESEPLSRRADELLRSIERAAYRVLNMANLSLDIFRMEQGSYAFRPQLLDLAALARRVAADLEGQAASKAVSLQVMSEGEALAKGEELLCYSMFANLIKNAVEAAPDGSLVAVRIESGDEWILCHVHNEGAVHAAIRSRFFEKYATYGKHSGLGLGTYSARLMARVQLGDVTLQTSEESGTTLTVRLQRASPAQKDEHGTTAATIPAALMLPERTQRVLVVDDDEFNRLALRHSLPTPPFQVELAVNGRAAVEAARRAWPDAVLLDLEMPVMDGYQTAFRLRELEREEGRTRCTIIAVTSNDEPHIMEHALAAGCDQCLVKPAPRETLLRILAGGVSADTPRLAAAPPGPDDAVVLDPDLLHTLPRFIESRRALLDEFDAALVAGDREAARRLAHKLAGAFAMYRFDWAAAESRALQREAAEASLEELSRRSAGLRRHLERVRLPAAAPTKRI